MTQDELNRAMNMSAEQLRRKADQAWEMAGLARQDGDTKDEIRQTENAREYQRLLREVSQ